MSKIVQIYKKYNIILLIALYIAVGILSYKCGILYGNFIYIVNKIPKYVFIYTFIISIVIQSIVILKFSNISRRIYPILSIVFSNIVALILPYSVAELKYTNNIIKIIPKFFETLVMNQENWVYLLILSYIIITIISFLLLYSETKSRGKLILSILLSNIIVSFGIIVNII